MSTKFYIGPNRDVPPQTYEFTTINSALGAVPANLSGQGIYELIVDKGNYAENVNVAVANGTSATEYIILRARTINDLYPPPNPEPAEARHFGIFGAGVIVRQLWIYGVATSHAKISDIEVNRTTSGGDCLYIYGGGNHTFTNILVKKNSATFRHIGFQIRDSSSVYKCCAVWDINNTTYSESYFCNGVINTFLNCVSYNSQAGFANNGGYCICNNCVADGGNGGVGGASSNNSFGSMAGHNFVDLANGDFHVFRTSNLLGAGVDKSSIFTEDVDYQYIREWMIGFDYVSPSCWSYKAKYKNSDRIFSIGGPDKYPSCLRVPKNVDISTGRMLDEDNLIDNSSYTIEQ